MLNRFCLMFPVLLLVSMSAHAFRRHVKQDFKFSKRDIQLQSNLKNHSHSFPTIAAVQKFVCEMIYFPAILPTVQQTISFS